MKQPEPSAADVAMWLKTISREQLQDQGWITINRRFHGIARATRPFLQAHFPDEQTQAAAFDGLTLALLAVAHFNDVESLSKLFTSEGASEVLAESADQLKARTRPATELPEPRSPENK